MLLPPLLLSTLKEICQRQAATLSDSPLRTENQLLPLIEGLPEATRATLETLLMSYCQAKASLPINLAYLLALESEILNLLGVTSAVRSLFTPPVVQTLQNYLPWFRKASQIVQNHLGRALVRNYWLISRPTHPWLRTIQVETFYTEQVPAPDRYLNEEQQDLLQIWLEHFLLYCSRLVPPLPAEAIAAGVPVPPQLLQAAD
ncbi:MULTISPECIES: hypothetical protein [unclassified Thermosynechococcus]|uniref:hypothetical protein n=1 Tax=unclassified Thermosynechococcus TaxID=2622553 RepID=UPI0019F2985D|nr:MULTISPECIES: hypothetical protein [unclassified Thermosynechococcus]HIK34385.1 hypothetical protein [Thermosynechococcus sp. M98_K2018_005]HIK47799.1 hypothetical protein [Thermosynechococcus sp. M55_K2018_012]